MRLVKLHESVGFGVIISFPMGVSYGNQTGGTSCLQPRLEGVYVPLRNDCEVAPSSRLVSPEHELETYFTGPPHERTGAVDGLDENDALFIDALLVRWRVASLVEVDRARLRDSHEAWVWAVVTGEEEDGIYAGLGPYPRPAVLTWSNSD